jgi:hypothetical protein
MGNNMMMMASLGHRPKLGYVCGGSAFDNTCTNNVLLHDGMHLPAH